MAPNQGKPASMPPRSFTPWALTTPKKDSRQSCMVLAVDGDAVSRRFLERAFARAGATDVTLELARDATSAFDVLRNSMVDLILSDTDLPDMSDDLRRGGSIGKINWNKGREHVQVFAFQDGPQDLVISREISVRSQLGSLVPTFDHFVENSFVRLVPRGVGIVLNTPANWGRCKAEPGS